MAHHTGRSSISLAWLATGVASIVTAVLVHTGAETAFGTPDGSWTPMATSGSAPAARNGQSATYDPVRNRMIVFGGSNGAGEHNDLWQLSLDGCWSWTPLQALGTTPPPRAWHTAVYDPVRDGMIVFGGRQGAPYINDVWFLSLSSPETWTQLTPSGIAPAARAYHAAILDAIRDRMIVFGGNTNSYQNDTWALSLGSSPSWQQLSPAGSLPPPREINSGFVFDAPNDRMVVFGGYNGSALSDTWALALGGSTSWNQILPSGSPPVPRFNHQTAYDAARGRMIVFGGRSASVPLGDTWVLTLSGSPAWSQLSPGGSPPGPHEQGTCIYSALLDAMILFGGDDGVVHLNDTWSLAFGDSLPRPSSTIVGTVTASCPSPQTPLLGVGVDVFDSLGVLVGSASTDESGSYVITGLLPSAHTVTVVTPLGYEAAEEDFMTLLTCGVPTTVDFAMECVAIVSNPRSTGFWKHQVCVATGGSGTAEVDATTLCEYLDIIAQHFNQSDINQVLIYEPPASLLCADKLQVAKTLLNLRGNAGMTARAKQQLMALLLNVPAGYVSQTQVVSADGATLSQAVTYCDYLIDGPVSGHETAKTIADLINNNQQVAAGVIPLSTDDIAYKRLDRPILELGLNRPNPFAVGTRIEYRVPGAGRVRLDIFDVSGRMVRMLVDRASSEGQYSETWDGRDDSGHEVAPGTYFLRLTTSHGDHVTERVTIVR